MANPSSTSEFTWGSVVKLTVDGSRLYQLQDNTGCVCGIDQIDSEFRARQFKVEISSYVYLIEDRTGSAVEIPEQYLIALDGEA